MLTKEQFEEEMRELSDTVEIATLDKEMAEEKVTIVTLYYCVVSIVKYIYIYFYYFVS